MNLSVNSFPCETNISINCFTRVWSFAKQLLNFNIITKDGLRHRFLPGSSEKFSKKLLHCRTQPELNLSYL